MASSFRPRFAVLLIGIATLTATAVADTGATGGVPEGLSVRDWAQIRESLKTERYRAQRVEETPIDGVDTAFYANSCEQQLHSYFSLGGVNVLPHDDAAEWQFGMRLGGWGWDGDLKSVKLVEPEADGNRIAYRRGILTEWFVNDRSGLEQGFTITESPKGGEPSTFHLEMQVSDGLRPSLSPDGRAILFLDDRGEAVLRYAGLRAWGADGRDLKAAFSVGKRVVEVIVDTTDAVYPITVDPTFTQVALLLPTRDPYLQTEAHFGASVAVDGDTAVIGAPDGDSLSEPGSGVAFVYVRSGATWEQQALLSYSVPAGQFGASVAIEGDRAVIGAPASEGGEGRAFVFIRDGTSWSDLWYLAASDGAAGDEFGTSVAIDGDTLVVGARYDDHTGGTNAGSAYVFVWNGTGWDQQAKLVAGDTMADDQFGDSVTISGDTAIVGALFHDHVISNVGAAYVFVRSGTTWTQQAELLASDRAFGDFLGGSVSLDGDTAVIGAEWDDHSVNNAGSAYVFVRSGTAWSEQAKLVASDAALTDRFGISVSVKGDTAVVGAHYDNHGALSDPGSAYVFLRSGTTWSEQAKLVGSTLDNGDRLGISVALSGDTVFAGASRDNVSGLTDPGSAWIFTRAGSNWSEVQNVIPSDGAEEDRFGSAVAIWDDTVAVGVGDDRRDNLLTTGSVYVFVHSGDTWSEQARLFASDAGFDDRFGTSVALEGDTLVVGSLLDDHSGLSRPGSAYVFERSGTVWTEQQKLVASNADDNDRFGNSVAISGERVVVGTPFYGGTHTGSAYVFERSGTSWTQQQMLTASDPYVFAYFGTSVSIDGDSLVVGAMTDSSGAVSEFGSAYVFVRSGGIWIEQQKLTAADAMDEDWFGTSVSIDGNTVLVGALGDDHSGFNQAGSVYVFVRTGGDWDQQQKLVASDPGDYDRFGRSVALSGNLAAIGSYQDSHSGFDSAGSVYIYTRSGATWSQQPKVVSSDPAVGDNFGASVAVFERRLAVGAPLDDDAGYSAGTAAIFRSYLADLAITKTDGQANAIPGDVVTYSLVGSNPVGPDDVTDAVVTDVFLPDLVACNWSCESTGGATCVPNGFGNINESVSLLVGSTVTYTANCIVAPGLTGTVTNTATVSSATVEDPNPADNIGEDTDTLTPQADLRVSKTDGRTSAIPGGRTVYTITAINDGLSDAPGVTVIDAFPGELSCTWSCVGSAATCTPTGTGPISDTVDLVVGASVVYTATCTIGAGAAGTLVNTAEVTLPPGVADPNPNNNSATDIDEIVSMAELIFWDDFENNNTTAWSTTLP